MPHSRPDPSILEMKFRGFADASLVIHSVQNRDELMILATSVIKEMLDAEGSNIALREPETGDLVFYMGSGEKYARLKSFRLAEGEGITGHCVRTASTVVVNDAQHDARFCSRADMTSGFTTRNMICVPLILDSVCIGAMSLVNKRHGAGFDAHDRVVCEAVAAQIAVAIQNVQLTRAAVEAARLAAMGQAVAGVAHCMKNLLYGLRGGLYVIRKDLKKAETGIPLRGLEMVERNFGKLVDLVQEMLAYAKERRPEYAPADPNGICRSAVDILLPVAAERGIRISFDPCEDLGPVELDSQGIHRCVMNLLSNAIDACEEEGAAAAVAVRNLGPGWMQIEVADEGCGMDEKTLGHLFQPFFSSKGSKGTGLGLTVTRKIVQEHGGRVEVESVEGKGSAFRLFLPKNRPKDGDAAEKA